jgi:hypothetical protein
MHRRRAATLALLIAAICPARAALPAHQTALAGSAPATAAYRVVRLLPGRADRGSFTPVAVADDHSVVGYISQSVTLNGEPTIQTRILLIAPSGTATTLAQPDGLQALQPVAMNNHHHIVATSLSDDSAYLYRDGTWLPLAGEPAAINDAGQIALNGYSGDRAASFLTDAWGHIVRTLGALPCNCATFAEAIAPNGVIYGRAINQDGNWTPVRFPPDGGPAVELSQPGETLDFNGLGVAVAIGSTAAGTANLISYDGKVVHQYGGIPGNSMLVPTGIDDHGDIAGYTAAGNPAPRDASSNPAVDTAFLHDAGGFEDLGTLAGLSPGQHLYRALGISHNGAIVALGDLGHGGEPLLLIPTGPTPSASADAQASLLRVHWVPTATPIPPTPTAPPFLSVAPASEMGVWVAMLDGIWILTLQAGANDTITGTAYNNGATYPLTGTYTNPTRGMQPTDPGSRGTIALTFTTPAGKYSVTLQFDERNGAIMPDGGDFKAPTLEGGMAFRRLAQGEGTPTPGATPTPANVDQLPAPPHLASVACTASGAGLVKTLTLCLSVPPGWTVAASDTTSVTLTEPGGSTGTPVRLVIVAGTVNSPTTVAAVEQQAAENYGRTFPDFKACAAEAAETVDGMAGIGATYCYTDPKAPGVAQMAHLWQATSKGGSVVYLYQLSGQAPLTAAQASAQIVLDTLQWLIFQISH